MLWIGNAALLLTIVEHPAHRRETLAQKQVEVRIANSTKTTEGQASNVFAPKRKLTPEKAEDKMSRYIFYCAVPHLS